MSCKGCKVFEECKAWLNHRGPEPKCPDDDVIDLEESIIDAHEPDC